MPSRAAASNVPERPVFPFTAIVGQEEMKLALLLNAIDTRVGGVLIMGHRGTGKSTAVRALADLLPPLLAVRDCLYGCDPLDQQSACADCLRRMSAGEKLRRVRSRVAVVNLPLGATEDRVCGTLNLERALTEGVKVFEPGLLARAHRGFLYIDEVNLLEDHLIDLLLDVAATGRNLVERESVSVEHPARFVLVGSGNPEEGELRPQLLDRFGLHVEVKTEEDADLRVRIVLAREAFDRDPAAFVAGVEAAQAALRRRLASARRNLERVALPHELLRRIAQLCLQLRIDGHRGELTISRAARALAALEGRRAVSDREVRRVAVMALRHRLRRDPLEQSGTGARVEQALDQFFPQEQGDGNKGREPQNSNGGSEHGEASQPESSATDGAARSRNREEEKRRAPAAEDARLPETVQPRQAWPARGWTRKESRASRKSDAALTVYDSARGRYTGSTASKPGLLPRVALDATLRAYAQRAAAAARRAPQGRATIEATDLRFKRFKRKKGTLYIFAVDASGSMALNRLGQAKGALAQLLRRSYIRRDRVALLSFRDRAAEILLPPSASVTRAGRLLDELYVGGATPLAAGIRSALDMALRARRAGTERIALLLFTDGRANVTLRGETVRAAEKSNGIIWRELELLGAELRRAGVEAVVVDTHNRFAGGDEGHRLAEELGGRHVYLSTRAADELDNLPV